MKAFYTHLLADVNRAVLDYLSPITYTRQDRIQMYVKENPKISVAQTMEIFGIMVFNKSLLSKYAFG